jgi:ParB-like nuclease domain
VTDLKMGTGGTIVPNTSMIDTGVAGDIRRRPENIRPIGLQHINIGKRERPLDRDKVEQIARSLLTEGLLQPVGVRKVKDGGYDLIYGHHRVAAALLNREKDPKLSVIAAVVFPATMPDWACKLAEVAENIHRKDLSPKQREAQTALYAGLLKKHGLVADANANRSATQKNVEDQGRDPNHSGHVPTTTQRVATELGVSDDTVRNRIANAAKTAERVGVTVSARTPEKMSGDELIAVGEAASQAAESDRQEALQKGIGQRYVNPHQPQKPTAVSARLDTVDPAPFIDWCRNRIRGRHKPMSLDMLKAYRQALDELIAEIEQRP